MAKSSVDLLNMLKKIAPEKFLCRYPLRTGALVSSIILSCVTIICCIALIVQVVLMKTCTACSPYVWRNAYSFSITGVIYCNVMLAAHGWLVWGVIKKKTTVLLSWVVITTMWLSQTLFLLVVLICIHSKEVNFVLWILTFLFGMIAICTLLYFILVVFGLWLQLKNMQKAQNIAVSSQ